MVTPLADGARYERPSSTASQRPDAAGLGHLLRSARERLGLTLEQVAKETRIPRTHLQAFEQDNLSAAPGGFYQRAQLRVYARALNLDPTLVLAQLERELEPSEFSDAIEAGKQKAPFFSKSVLIVLGVMTAAGALGLAIGGRIPAFDRPQRISNRAEPAPSGQRIVDATAPATPAGLIAGGPADPVRHPVDLAPAQTDLAASPPPLPAPADLASTPADLPRRAGPQPALAVTIEPAAPPAPAPQSTTLAPSIEQPPARVPPGPVSALVIATEPAGARVTVNGIGWGTTPVTIRYLPSGEKRIRVSKEGYAAEERVVTVAEGRQMTLDIPLRSIP